METPDQYVHRAERSDLKVMAMSADGSLTPLFPHVHGAAAPHPAKLSQLDRRIFPLNPPGDFSPPVPQGRGGLLLSRRTRKTSYLK